MTRNLATTSAIAVVIVVEIYCIIYILTQFAPLVTPSLHSKLYCDHVRNVKKTMQKVSKRITPPWSHVPINKILYVWPHNAGRFRLGNRLFNYAATFGIAWQNQHRPLLPYTTKKRQQYDLARYFNILIPVDHDNQIVEGDKTQAITLKEAEPAVYDERLTRLPARNVSLRDYLQSYKYFQKVEDQLRLELTFRPNVLDEACKWMSKQTPKKWKKLTFVRILIHVRRTDFNNPNMERTGWPRPTLDYFRRSMSYFTSCLERVLFVVMSDDLAWCREHINATDIVYSSGHSPVVDMAIASLCDHAIITVGTYGWWAAWFANGITITQKSLPTKNSSLAKLLHRDDFYKPEWIGL